MKKRASSLIVAVCFFLGAGGCDTGKKGPAPGASEQPGAQQRRPEEPRPAVTDNRPVIVAFGDSLTAGVSGISYPERLQSLLDAAGERYRVDNQGVSGDTTTDGLARIDNVIAAHPALVLLEFGGNDGLRGIPVAATQANLEQMIEKLKASRIPTVLLGITLPPNYGPEYVRPFTAMFPAVAKKYRLPVFPFLLVHVYQDPNLMQPDGIHPNDAGNKVVAQDVFRLLQPMLRRNG